MARFALLYRNERILLSRGEFVLGRSRECNLPLDDQQVSRRHVILHVGSDRVRVEDLGSRNGSLVNGERVEGTRALVHGDRLQIGAQQLELVEEEGLHRRANDTTLASGENPVRDPDGVLALLSRRELDVLRLVALGHTHKEVAEELSISVKTVESYRERLAQKAGLKTRADLVQCALESGLLIPKG